MATPEYAILDLGGFGRRKKIVWAEKSDTLHDTQILNILIFSHRDFLHSFNILLKNF